MVICPPQYGFEAHVRSKNHYMHTQGFGLGFRWSLLLIDCLMGGIWGPGTVEFASMFGGQYLCVCAQGEVEARGQSPPLQQLMGGCG
jgi:hypothetical protein